MSERHQIWKVADAIQMDLRAAQAKLVELRGLLSSIDIPDELRPGCPVCGVRLRGPATLAEHLYKAHDGPLPENWARIEALSVDPLEPEEATA